MSAPRSMKSGNCPDDCVKELAEMFKEAWAKAYPPGHEAHGERVEVVISTMKPLVMNPYVEGMTCPHGVTFWMEPTSEQIADWAKRGVA